jgi:transcriptional regulator with GAF, ATPase, and Fis domain
MIFWRRKKDAKKKKDATDRPGTFKAPEVQALCEIAQLVGSAAELETTLSEILRILHDTLYMERASLVLLDEAAEHLTIKASYGLSTEEEERGVYHLDEGVIGKVFRSKVSCSVTKKALLQVQFFSGLLSDLISQSIS